MNNSPRHLTLAIGLLSCFLASSGEKNYSPNVGDTFPNNVFFGDTHLHTSYSTDAGMVGNNLEYY